MTSPIQVAAVVIGDDRLSAQLVSSAEISTAWTREAVSNSADLALSRIRANASGRPGPNAPTGDYRRSWSRQTSTSKLAYSVSVGTNRPQARRLEFGFVGQDSLGRNYHQPAYPHVEPAIPFIWTYFSEQMDKIRSLVIGGGGSLTLGGES